jgi:hypothetical protein
MGFDEYLTRGYLPELAGLSENQIADTVLTALGPMFFLEREVWGTHCSGARVRLDAILRPRDPTDWFDEAPAFGVEFKSRVDQGAEALGQCANYMHTMWDGYGVLPIFLCPAVCSRWAWARGGEQGAWLVTRMLGQFGVGELDWVNQGGRGRWRLERAGTCIWDSDRGPSAGSVSSLAVKVGHR